MLLEPHLDQLPPPPYILPLNLDKGSKGVLVLPQQLYYKQPKNDRGYYSGSGASSGSESDEEQPPAQLAVTGDDEP